MASTGGLDETSSLFNTQHVIFVSGKLWVYTCIQREECENASNYLKAENMSVGEIYIDENKSYPEYWFLYSYAVRV